MSRIFYWGDDGIELFLKKTKRNNSNLNCEFRIEGGLSSDFELEREIQLLTCESEIVPSNGAEPPGFVVEEG
jgi:hypothetical protein